MPSSYQYLYFMEKLRSFNGEQINQHTKEKMISTVDEIKNTSFPWKIEHQDETIKMYAEDPVFSKNDKLMATIERIGDKFWVNTEPLMNEVMKNEGFIYDEDEQPSYCYA